MFFNSVVCCVLCAVCCSCCSFLYVAAVAAFASRIYTCSHSHTCTPIYTHAHCTQSTRPVLCRPKPSKKLKQKTHPSCSRSVPLSLYVYHWSLLTHVRLFWDSFDTCGEPDPSYGNEVFDALPKMIEVKPPQPSTLNPQP